MFELKMTTSIPPPNFNGQETTPADGDHSSGLRVVAQLPFTPLKGKSEGKLQSAAGERWKTRLLMKVLLEVWLSAQGAPAPAGRASCRTVAFKAQGVIWPERTVAPLPMLHKTWVGQPPPPHTHTEVTLQTVKSGAFI